MHMVPGTRTWYQVHGTRYPSTPSPTVPPSYLEYIHVVSVRGSSVFIVYNILI
jgi:hypothetical protein